MKIIQIISEHKKIKRHITVFVNGEKKEVDIPPPVSGYKRVEAIVEIDGFPYTKHMDVVKDRQ